MTRLPPYSIVSPERRRTWVAVLGLRGAGFGVYPTGANADHFDVLLIGGLSEGDPAASASDLRDAVVQVLAVGGSLKPNPAYAGDTAESSQEER